MRNIAIRVEEDGEREEIIRNHAVGHQELRGDWPAERCVERLPVTSWRTLSYDSKVTEKGKRF